MIIFNLDEVLADCEHRRHFIDRYHPINEKRRLSEILLVSTPDPDPNQYIWRPDYKAYNEACADDKPIECVRYIFEELYYAEKEIEIWSGRCESVREKIEIWINKHLGGMKRISRLVMRPIGDETPEWDLKNRWINERCPDLMSHVFNGDDYAKQHGIEMVFESDPQSIEMYRRRGIFVFDCNQRKE